MKAKTHARNLEAEILARKESTKRRLVLVPLLSIIAGVVALVGASTPAYATYPGHNGLITFGANTGSGVQLYTVRSNGHDLQQITHGPGEALHPDWSPDGQSIVFEHDWDTETQCATIDVMDPDGSNQVSLTTGVGGCEGQPSFMPDGARIVYDHFDFTTFDAAIWGMNADGSNQHRIIDPWPNGLGFTTDGNVSPDGETLSFVGFDGNLFGPPPNSEPAQGLFASDLDGNNLSQLLPFTLDLAIKHDWAPDGKHIVVTTNANFFNPGESANIATIRPDGSDLHYLTHYQGGAVNAFVGSYSPDGKYIVFRLEDQGSYALMKMRSDGSHMQPILGLSSFRPRYIDWGARTPGDE
jgi:Tol biopolymer transport system component